VPTRCCTPENGQIMILLQYKLPLDMIGSAISSADEAHIRHEILMLGLLQARCLSAGLPIHWVASYLKATAVRSLHWDDDSIWIMLLMDDLQGRILEEMIDGVEIQERKGQ